VLGGKSYTQLHSCGTRYRENNLKLYSACGGFYDTFLHDVWRTPDGFQWELVTIGAAWSERIGHTLDSINMGGSIGTVLFLTGGMAKTNGPSSTAAPSNDVWISSNGSTWEALTLDAPWAPRSEHVALMSVENTSDTIVIVGGLGEHEILEDVWVWKKNPSGSYNWAADFGPGSGYHEAYLTTKSPVGHGRELIYSITIV